ncbi:hypothetical protein DFH06DRAFT_1395313, partial [Mycena polygramma]
TTHPFSRYSGINILHRASAPEAFHDSADNYDQPRCHPETRIEMQEKLLGWCLTSEWRPTRWRDMTYKMEPAVLWLHGPAGAGKSAIMYTISERLMAEGRLGGAFFFKRGHATRGNARALFTTIALQLAVFKTSAVFKPLISKIVEENPTLVSRSISVQLQELIVKPGIGLNIPPRTIVVDGLDECQGQGAQQEILRLILNSTRQHTSLRFLVASRPEAHIREVLEETAFHSLYRAFDIQSCFKDVRRYLVAEFARIHREHKTMAAIPRPWPSEDVIERLVRKSSGYFIYATTAIKFVDDKNFRPTRRLEAVEYLVGTGDDSPFGALDTLYTGILSTVPKSYQLVPILRVIENLPARLTCIDTLLHLDSGDTELCLRGLHSVIDLKPDYELDPGSESNSEGPHFYHASFSDFLRDPCRAGAFYIGDLGGIVDVMRVTLTALSYSYEEPIRNRDTLWEFTWHLLKCLPVLLKQVEPSSELIQLLSTVNYDFMTEHIITGNTPVGRGLLSWLEEARPPPEDLIGRCRDHEFLETLAAKRYHETLFGTKAYCDPEIVLNWRQVSRQVMEHVAHYPLLLHICCGIQWTLFYLDPDEYLAPIRHLLDVSWGEIHAAVRGLRSILRHSDSKTIRAISWLVIQDWRDRRPGWRADICSKLAQGYIRVCNMVDAGSLPAYFWHFDFPWGRVIRGSPPCPVLLSAVYAFVPPRGQETHPDVCWLECQAEQCHNVTMWLQNFADRPEDEIRRWAQLFEEARKRKRTAERPSYFYLSGDVRYLRKREEDSYERSWRQWDTDYPE